MAKTFYQIPDLSQVPGKLEKVGVRFAKGNVDLWVKRKKGGAGRAWVAQGDERVIEAPDPSNPTDLYVWLHETAHHALGHIEQEKPYHLEEYEATEKALGIMRGEGIEVPESLTEEAKWNVWQAAERDRKEGLEIEPRVERFLEGFKENGMSGNPHLDLGRAGETNPSIKAGDYVKALFENSKGEGERMWVKVASVSGGRIQGRLDNDPVFKHGGLKRGSHVSLSRKDVIEHLSENPGNPARSAEQYGLAQAVVSGTARTGGMPVGVARRLIEETPKGKRREYARELAGKRGNPWKGIPVIHIYPHYGEWTFSFLIDGSYLHYFGGYGFATLEEAKKFALDHIGEPGFGGEHGTVRWREAKVEVHRTSPDWLGIYAGQTIKDKRNPRHQVFESETAARRYVRLMEAEGQRARVGKSGEKWVVMLGNPVGNPHPDWYLVKTTEEGVRIYRTPDGDWVTEHGSHLAYHSTMDQAEARAEAEDNRIRRRAKSLARYRSNPAPGDALLWHGHSEVPATFVREAGEEEEPGLRGEYVIRTREGTEHQVHASELKLRSEMEPEREIALEMNSVRKPTIYEALRAKLGREPTDAELKADVERIKREAVDELARLGKLPHQRRGRRNPEGESADMYESFHGRPSESVMEFEEEEHYHGNLAELGELVQIKVVTLSGYKCDLEFETGEEEGEEEEGEAENPRGKQKWILPYKRGKKNYEDVGYLPFALEHDIGFSGSKMYRPVKVGEDRSITVGSTELGSVDFDRYSRKSAIDAIRKLAGRAENPRGLQDTLVHTVTAYDMKQQGKRGYNMYALPQYLGAVERVMGEINAGTPVRKALTNNFSGRLLDRLLKSVGEATSTREEQMYNPTANPRRHVKVPPEVDAAAKELARKGYRGEAGDPLPNLMSGASVDWINSHLEVFRDRVQEHRYRITLPNPEPGYTPASTLLCSNEDGTQLYFLGGDQSLDLSKIHMDGDWEKDSMIIGVVCEVSYRTEKSFDKFVLTDYFHRLGEETGDEPMLIYDRMNEKLSVSGGKYRIERPLVGVSPGIEN